MADVAHTVSAATGRDIRYVDTPPAEAVDRLRYTGLPPAFQAFLMEHYDGVARGRFDLVTDVVERVGRVTPRTLDDFLREGEESNRWQSPRARV
jgi:hypothetical protein